VSEPKRRAPMLDRAVDMVLRYWPTPPSWQQLAVDYDMDHYAARVRARAVRDAFERHEKRRALG
jgi:hypothetical protein